MKLKLIGGIGIICYVLFVFLTVAHFRFELTFLFLEKFSTIQYQDNLTTDRWIMMQVWVLIYAIIACWMTWSVGIRYKLLWLVGCILDVLIYFISLFLIILYNNYHYKAGITPLLSTTENIFLIYSLQYLKKVMFRPFK